MPSLPFFMLVFIAFCAGDPASQAFAAPNDVLDAQERHVLSKRIITSQPPTRGRGDVASPPGISRFLLVAAETGEELGIVHDGAVIDLQSLPSRSVNIRAETVGSTTAVHFELNGWKRFRIETAPPFALAGDRGGKYLPWTPQIGHYRMRGTPYRGGIAGSPRVVHFEVVDGARAPTPRHRSHPPSDNPNVRMPEAPAAFRPLPDFPSGTTGGETVPRAIEPLNGAGIQAHTMFESTRSSLPTGGNFNEFPPLQAVTSSAAPLPQLPLPQVGERIAPREEIGSVFPLVPKGGSPGLEAHASASLGKCVTFVDESLKRLTIGCSFRPAEPSAVSVIGATKQGAVRKLCDLGVVTSPVVSSCELSPDFLLNLELGQASLRVRQGRTEIEGRIPAHILLDQRKK